MMPRCRTQEVRKRAKWIGTARKKCGSEQNEFTSSEKLADANKMNLLLHRQFSSRICQLAASHNRQNWLMREETQKMLAERYSNFTTQIAALVKLIKSARDLPFQSPTIVAKYT